MDNISIDALIEEYGLMEGLTVRGDVIEEWPFAEPMPSKEECMRLTNNWLAATEYKRKRKAEYPSEAEAIRMLANDIRNGTRTLADLEDSIDAKYPPPVRG